MSLLAPDSIGKRLEELVPGTVPGITKDGVIPVPADSKAVATDKAVPVGIPGIRRVRTIIGGVHWNRVPIRIRRGDTHLKTFGVLALRSLSAVITSCFSRGFTPRAASATAKSPLGAATPRCGMLGL